MSPHVTPPFRSDHQRRRRGNLDTLSKKLGDLAWSMSWASQHGLRRQWRCHKTGRSLAFSSDPAAQRQTSVFTPLLASVSVAPTSRHRLREVHLRSGRSASSGHAAGAIAAAVDLFSTGWQFGKCQRHESQPCPAMPTGFAAVVVLASHIYCRQRMR